jgi:hypothetical protein
MQGQPRATLSRREIGDGKESKRKGCGNMEEIGDFSFLDPYEWKRS